MALGIIFSYIKIVYQHYFVHCLISWGECMHFLFLCYGLDRHGMLFERPHTLTLELES